MENRHDDKLKATEENSPKNSSFSDQIPTTFSPFPAIFDCESSEIKNSISGFTDMLEIQDYNPSLFDMFQTPPPPPPPPPPPEMVSTSGNSTSISSSSTDVTNDTLSTTKTTTCEDQQEQDDDDQDKNINKHHELKPKKKNTKKPRQPRFAFMTKSDVDHLDDGYRWRKYGQKAVKNSPFPRSYYRCTTAACGVKKRVERSSQDSSIVVTTYEGTHTHQCPLTPRGNSIGVVPEMAGTGLSGGGVLAPAASPNIVISQPYNNYQFYNPHNHQLPILSTPFDLSTNYINNPNYSTSSNSTMNPMLSDFIHQETIYYPPYSSSSSPSSSSSASMAVTDRGLLQDMIMPSQGLQEDPKDDHEL